MAARLRPTLDDKVKLIEQFEKSGMSKNAFAKKYNIPRSSFSDILASKAKLYDSLQTFNGSKRKRLRKSIFKDIEEELLKWVMEAKAKNMPLSGIIIKEKAFEIAKELGNHDFSGSNGWLERFKDRHGLSFKKMSGNAMNIWLQCLTLQPSDISNEKICIDSSPVIFVSVEEWKNTVLKYVLDWYHPSDIYNFDKTQLLYRLLPEKCSEYKKNKGQITVLLGVNMTGTDKLKPLVIGKCVMPKCFKNVNIQSLPVTYRSNPEMCISSELWLETIKELDKKFENEKRKVAIILDDYSLSTKVKKLKAVELICMPPNVASVLQPLNQEIILNFKNNYRKFLIRDWINAIDDNCNFNPTILDAIEYTFKSWKNVSARTILNCFRKAGFLDQDRIYEVDDEGDIEKNISLAQLFQELTKRGKVLLMDENSYLNIDNISISNQKAFKASAKIKGFDSKSDDETSESDSGEVSERPPSIKEALRSFNIVKKYLLSIKGTTLKNHECLYQIEHRILNSSSENSPASTNKHILNSWSENSPTSMIEHKIFSNCSENSSMSTIEQKFVNTCFDINPTNNISDLT